MTGTPKKVAVLLGGVSSEREVSLNTGRQIAAALAAKGYVVREIDTARAFVRELEEFAPDVVFIALHGRMGEDGTIQGLLEVLGYPYTGSGVLASALAMNKVMTKKILLSEGINTAAFRAFTASEVAAKGLEAVAAELSAALGLPLVVKPACQGSTIGVSVVRGESELPGALELALRFDSLSFAESYIEGTEVTAPILGTDDPRVLPLIEVVSEKGFYDYEAKYTPGLSHHIIPARISERAAREVAELALRTYRALGCRHFARIDFIVGKDDVPYVLEVNTIPGMTPVSLFPDAARAAGISFPDLVAYLVEEAWRTAGRGGEENREPAREDVPPVPSPCAGDCSCHRGGGSRDDTY